jgi:hypothetical protein
MSNVLKTYEIPEKILVELCGIIPHSNIVDPYYEIRWRFWRFDIVPNTTQFRSWGQPNYSEAFRPLLVAEQMFDIVVAKVASQILLYGDCTVDIVNGVDQPFFLGDTNAQ